MQKTKLTLIALVRLHRLQATEKHQISHVYQQSILPTFTRLTVMKKGAVSM